MTTYASVHTRLYHTQPCKAIRDSILDGKLEKNYIAFEDADYEFLNRLLFHECFHCERLAANVAFEEDLLPKIEPLMQAVVDELGIGKNYEFRIYEYMGDNKTPQMRYRCGVQRTRDRRQQKWTRPL